MDTAIRRSQIYAFLASSFLYPHENWLDDLPAIRPILAGLELANFSIPDFPLDLAGLQSDHRRALGLTGSLCYETEYGLPSEFRQSQELADIAGFYRAFGFDVGGVLRERPDHLAMELEFMYVLALKEAYAAQQSAGDHLEVCRQAQARFLQDHLGRWVGLFAASLEKAATASDEESSPYLWLARLARAFIAFDAGRLGIAVEERPLAAVQHTPVLTDFSCGDCPAA